MHENAHNEGAAQYSAPNSTGTGWHCNEYDDILCYVDGGDKNQTMVPCSVEPGIQALRLRLEYILRLGSRTGRVVG